MTRRYKAEDLSGNGAADTPGRWNRHNQHVLYAALTLAIAVLETAAHLRAASLPLDGSWSVSRSSSGRGVRVFVFRPPTCRLDGMPYPVRRSRWSRWPMVCGRREPDPRCAVGRRARGIRPDHQHDAPRRRVAQGGGTAAHVRAPVPSDRRVPVAHRGIVA